MSSAAENLLLGNLKTGQANRIAANHQVCVCVCVCVRVCVCELMCFFSVMAETIRIILRIAYLSQLMVATRSSSLSSTFVYFIF